MARRPFAALGVFASTAGTIIIRKVFAKKQATWLLICEGPHAGLRQLLPDWRPRAPSTRTQITPPAPIKRVSDIIAFYGRLVPVFYERLAGKPVPLGVPTAAQSYRTLSELLRVVEREAATSLRAGSLETYGHQWAAVLRVLDPGMPLVELTRERLQDAMGVLGKQYAATTLKNLRNALSKLLVRAVEDGMLARNPLERVKIPKAIARPKQILTRVQRDALLTEAEKRGESVHLLFALLLFAGLRRREALAVSWADIDLEHRTLTVKNSADFTTKSGEARVVPLCTELFAALVRYRRGTGLVLAPEKAYGAGRYRWSFTKVLTSVAVAAGVPWFHAHLARHAFATLYLEGGGNIHRLAGYMGHSTVEVTALYGHHRPGTSDIHALSSVPA
jgi:integrase